MSAIKNNRKSLRWSWIILFPIILRILMIALTFPYMWVYSSFINSDQPPGFYEVYVFENRAWISAILGVPVFYYACYWMSLRVKTAVIKNCLFMVGMYIIMDIPLELAVGDLSDWRLVIAHLSKVIVGYLAGTIAENKIKLSK